jgi:hypothetical protein
MQREKLYNLQRTVYFLSVLFMFKEVSNSVRPVFHNGKRLVVQSFSVFETKKYTIKINFSLQFVELFTLHLVVYFVFLKYSDIRGNNNRRIKTCCKKIRKNVGFESCNSWTNRLYRMSQNNGDYLR